jgi:hypothetical protein
MRGAMRSPSHTFLLRFASAHKQVYLTFTMFRNLLTGESSTNPRHSIIALVTILLLVGLFTSVMACQSQRFMLSC